MAKVQRAGQSFGVEMEFGDTFWRNIAGLFSGFILADVGFGLAVAAQLVTGDSKTFWFLNRSTGLVAYVLIWASVAWGLLLSTKLGKGTLRVPGILDAHQYLSSLAVGFAVFHGLILMGDHYLSFTIGTVLIPFTGAYKPLLVALGQFGMWLSFAMILSFFARKWIGYRLWRRLHYFSFVAFWSALAHGALLGTDSKFLWAQIMYLTTGGVILYLFLYRIIAMLEEHLQHRRANRRKPVLPVVAPLTTASQAALNPFTQRSHRRRNGTLSVDLLRKGEKAGLLR